MIKWEYGVHHVTADGWGEVTPHSSEISARDDLSSCGMNCSLVRREVNAWEGVMA